MAAVEISDLQEGFAVLKKTDGSKLPKVIGRIAQSVSNNAGIHEAFSTDEKEKLAEVLLLEHNYVEMMLQTIQQCFLFAAYHGMKPQNFCKKLSDFVDESISDIMTQAWQKYGRDIIATLKKNTLSANRLNKIDWHLNLQVAQASKSRIGEPNVVFQLCSQEGDVSNDMIVEMNHDELQNFYSKLETIQEQLDALS